MTDARSREEQNADAPEYEPPSVASLGSIDELTAVADGGSLDDSKPGG